MDIFTEAFTYNGDGTFTITEEALRKVFYKLHTAAAVECSSLRKFDNYYQALSDYENLKLSQVEDGAEREKLVEEMDYDAIEALADYSVDKLKGKR